MSFLRINGWEIPVGPMRHIPNEIGGRTRAFNGDPGLHRRAIKSTYRGSMPRQLPDDATALYGAIMGLGEVFPYDADLYSRSGIGVVSGTLGTIVPGEAGSGQSVTDHDAVAESKFGAGALVCEDAATNILDADTRDAEDAPAGYGAYGGAAIAANTTYYMQGAKSVKATAAGANEGLTTDAVACAAATTYNGSVYLMSVGSLALTVSLQDDVGQIDTVNITLANQVWRRVAVSGATAGGATTIHIRVETTSGAGVFYGDMFQITAGANLSSWYDGARGASDLEYDASLVTASYDLTFACWAKAPSANPGADAVMFSCGESASVNSVVVRRNAGADHIQVELNGDDSGDSWTYTTVWSGAWEHVAVTLRSRNAAGVAILTIYLDGASVGSWTVGAAEYPNLTRATQAWVGHDDGADFWGGTAPETNSGIDDVVVAPYAMTAAQILALYGLGKAMSGLPEFYVDGDFLSAPALTALALGRVEGEPYREAGSDGTWYSNMRELEFEIDLI